MSLEFVSSVLTSVIVLISFQINFCFPTTIRLLTCTARRKNQDVPGQSMIPGHPNRLYFAMLPTSSASSGFSLPCLSCQHTLTRIIALCDGGMGTPIRELSPILLQSQWVTVENCAPPVLRDRQLSPNVVF